jgi:hypothetical protein
MRRAAPVGVLLCSLASVLLISCGDDTPTSIPESSSETSFAVAASACDPKTTGGGFGLGVTKDDREAYVSIPALGLVQIFDLQSRRLSRAIPVGGDPAPDRL